MDFMRGMNLPSGGPSPMTGSTSPATVAPQSTGMNMAGRAGAVLGMKMLEKALMTVGSETAEGKAVIQALSVLNKAFGVVSPDIQRAEAKMIGESVESVGPSPQMADSIRQGLTGRGMPGGGMPPGMPAGGMPPGRMPGAA